MNIEQELLDCTICHKVDCRCDEEYESLKDAEQRDSEVLDCE